MKKILVIVLIGLVLMGCKDKKKTEPSANNATTSSVQSTKQISVKINGTDFSCSTCGNSYSCGGLSGLNFSEGATNRFVFSITGFLKPGSYTISQSGNPSFTYEKDGHYYRGKGSLTLTESDTSSNGSLKKFIGTFNCVTDTNTTSGVFYNFSEGLININFK